MSESLQSDMEVAVSSAHGCSCSHAGTFFVEEMVDGQPKPVAVETFQLRGHPEATQAFAWAWNDRNARRYIAVLGVPPTDSPQEAVRAAMANRGKESSGLAENVCGMLPGSHVKLFPSESTTKAVCDFEFLDRYTVFRPEGDLFFAEAVHLIGESLSFASFLGFDRLLVDATGLTGFPAPNGWQRFWMGMEWASVTKSLRLALVARPEMIDPGHFGIAVARNLGLCASVFATEEEAVDWLLLSEPS